MPTPLRTGAVAIATMVKDDVTAWVMLECDASSRPDPPTSNPIALVALWSFAAGRSFHGLAVLFDVFLDGLIVQLKVPEDSRVYKLERWRLLVAPQSKAHLENRSPEELLLG